VQNTAAPVLKGSIMSASTSASTSHLLIATLLAILFAVISPLTVSAQEAPVSSLLVRLVPGLSPAQQADVIARNGGVETSTVLALRLHVVAVVTADLTTVLARYQADPQVQHVELKTTWQSETLRADTDNGLQAIWSVA
jgi:hypothetical protein